MTWLAEELTTLALCWRIERRDGVTIGLTDHDRDLVLDGLTHRAAPGMVPSAIKRSSGIDADTMQVAGALTNDAVREDDLIGGRWDGARVVLAGVDWTGVGEPVALGEGRLGAVDLSDQGFTAELAGIAAALDRPVVEATAPECRAELGDARCRVAMAGRRRFARLVAVEDAVLTCRATSCWSRRDRRSFIWRSGPNAACRHGHLVDRPDRDPLDLARRQGAADHHYLQLCRLVRGAVVAAGDRRCRADLGGRQFAARCGGRFQGVDRVSPPYRR